MSRISRDIFTQLDLNGPYLRIDSQPSDITKESVFGNSGPGRESRYTATFSVVVSTYYMTGDEADIVTTPTTYNVTVASKTSSHPYFGRGSGNGYYITGGIYHEVTESPNLQFVKGRTYVFTQNDASATPHPMYFSAVETAYGGASRYETGVTYTLDGVNVSYTAYVSGFAAATQRSVSITVDAGAPSTLYYACAVHQYMGNAVTVNDTSDNVIEEDAVPPTVDDSGSVAYQWYEQRGSSQNVDTDIRLRDGIDDTSGVNTPTLSITNLQSPADNQRKFYCLLDYVPSQYETGNAVNETFTSITATLTVLPHIIIDTQPADGEGRANVLPVDYNIVARLSDTFFADDLTYQWYEVPEGRELTPILINDGTAIFNRISTTIEDETIIENIIKEETFTERVPKIVQRSTFHSTQVGIPTEAVSVKVKVAGGKGGKGGDESSSWTGGAGGLGRYAEFEFNATQIDAIRNRGSRTQVFLNAGKAGNDGPSNVSDPTAIGNGGLCAIQFQDELGNPREGSGGDGGFAGPNGTSGAGGGGGGCSSFDILDGGEFRTIAVSGAGGGGGGASDEASGRVGENADEYSVFSTSDRRSDVAQATPVNFNPACAETSDAINIDYGIYTKTATAKSDLVGASPDRLVIIWDGNVVYNRPRANILIQNDSEGYYIQSGNTKYYASAHRSSLLGWCDDNSCGTCTRLATEAQDPTFIDTPRQTGGYANAFDIVRVINGTTTVIDVVGNPLDPDDGTDAQVTVTDESIPLEFGGNGQDKITGNGGGGGGAGAGAITPKDGGNAGADEIPGSQARITVNVSGNTSILGSRYIRMVPVSGGTPITFNASNLGTRQITVTPGSIWDIVSDIDDGLSSENIQLLPNLNRSVGLDVFTDGRGDFDDLVVEFSDGEFKNISRTIFNDGEFLGRSIIQFIAPSVNINGTRATGGEGGGSAYRDSYLTKTSESTHNGDGYVEMTITTQKPYDRLTQTRTPVSIIERRSYSGTKTPNLRVSSDYAFSSRFMCRIKSTIASPIKVLDSRIPQLLMLPEKADAITIEEIGTDGFARISSVDLENADLFLRPSTEGGSNKTEYYSFYSRTDVDVDIKLFGGKGANVNGNAGGNGGFAYMRLRMQANTEYVIAGLDIFNNTPFLFKKGNLIATVGAGGNAGWTGPGADGGGTLQGGNSAIGGAIGGTHLTSLPTNGIVGSASELEAIAPDTKAPIYVGGRTLNCSKGTYWRGQSLSPCQDIPGNSQFRLADGTVVTNTSSISRGFKAGYNIFNTAGLGDRTGADIRESRGGSGATGGGGGRSGSGGAGGSGFISQGPELFMRYSFIDDEDGVTAGSKSGRNNGEPFVQISKVDVATTLLDQFIEYPRDLVIGVSDIDVDDADVFEPLPIVSTPDPAREPVPIVRITSPTFPRGTSTIHNVNEGGTVNVDVETFDIPPYSRLYWRLTYNGASAADFTSTEGYFDTTPADDGTSRCLGNFDINIVEDLTTEFINGTERFGFKIFSNSLRTVQVASTPGNYSFNIVDTSRTPPTASVVVTDLPSLGSTPITMYEGETRTFNIRTDDIPVFPDVFPSGNLRLNWEVDLVENVQLADFVQPSGYVDISVADPSTSVTGTGSFNIQTFEDFATESGTARFNIKLFYDGMTTLGLGTELFSGRGIREDIIINDTSQDPVYILTPETTTLDENNYQLQGSLGGDYDLDLGESQTFTLSTNWVTTGTTFYWQIVSGANNTTSFTAITSGDFVDASGTFTITAGTVPGSTLPGSGTVAVRTFPEGSIEGTEDFTIQIHRTTDSFGNPITYPNATSLAESSNITVTDTARPYYYVTPTAIGLDENAAQTNGSNFGTENFDLDLGDSATISLSTNYIASGTTFFYEIKDSGNSVATGQFVNASGTFTVSGSFHSSTGTFTITTVPDGVLDGAQTYTLRIYQGTSSSDPEITTGDTVYPNAVSYPLTIIVNDTAFPKYQLRPTSVSMTENGSSLTVGDTDTFTLRTEYVTPGSTFFYQIINDTTSLEATADFVASSGQFTIASGGSNSFFSATTTFDITTNPDGILEGTENFTINVYAGPNNSSALVQSSTISVDDTAFPIYRVTKTGTVDDFDETINEIAPSNTVTLDAYIRYPTGNTSPYPPTDPATVYWQVFKSDGSTVADAADFDGAISGNFTADTSGTNEVTISSAITLTAADDFATDSANPEVFIIKIGPDPAFPDLSGTIVAQNFTLSINDTSQDPIYTVSGSSSINEIDTSAPPYDPTTEIYTLTTTNVLITDTLLYKIVKSDLTDASADFNDVGYISSDSVTGEWQYQSGDRNEANWRLRLQPTDDRNTDGDKDFIIQTYNGSYDNTNRTSFAFTVVDNSNTPSYAISGNDSLTEIGPTSETYTLTTVNVNPGDTIYYEVGPSGAVDSFNDVGYDSDNSVRGRWQNMSGNRFPSASWRARIQPKDDFFTNGDQNYTLTASSGGYVSQGFSALASFDFTVTDDSNTRGYSISADSTEISEGDSIVFTLTTSNVETSDDLEFEIFDSEGFFAGDLSDNDGSFTSQPGSTRASGTHKATISADEDSTSQGTETYTVNVYNTDVDSSEVVASMTFDVLDTSKGAASYSMTSTVGRRSTTPGDTIKEKGTPNQINYTITSTDDTGGDDTEGGVITKGSTFVRYYSFNDDSDYTQFRPENGAITFTITSETSAENTIAVATFSVRSVQDEISEGGGIDSWDLSLYKTERDKNRDNDPLEIFYDALNIEDNSQSSRYFVDSEGTLANRNSRNKNTGYSCDEGTAFTVYLNCSDPPGTEVEFVVENGNAGYISDGYSAADGSEFDLSPSDGIVTTVEHTTTKASFVKSQAQIQITARADDTTEGQEEARLTAYIGGDKVILYAPSPGTWDYCPILVADTSIEEIEGCTNPSSPLYNPDATVDDGSCPAYIYGSYRTIACYKHQLRNTKWSVNDKLLYPKSIYHHQLEIGAAHHYNSSRTDTSSRYYLTSSTPIFYFFWDGELPSNAGDCTKIKTRAHLTNQWDRGAAGTGFDFPYTNASYVDTNPNSIRRHYLPIGNVEYDRFSKNYFEAVPTGTELLSGSLVPIFWIYKNAREHPEGSLYGEKTRFDEIFSTDVNDMYNNPHSSDPAANYVVDGDTKFWMYGTGFDVYSNQRDKPYGFGVNAAKLELKNARVYNGSPSPQGNDRTDNGYAASGSCFPLNEKV